MYILIYNILLLLLAFTLDGIPMRIKLFHIVILLQKLFITNPWYIHPFIDVSVSLWLLHILSFRDHIYIIFYIWIIGVIVYIYRYFSPMIIIMSTLSVLTLCVSYNMFMIDHKDEIPYM